MSGEADAEAGALNPIWQYNMEGAALAPGASSSHACIASLKGLDKLSAPLCLVCCLCTISFLCASVILKDVIDKALQNG